jgi:uncharacterized repeat protein (TIGR03803 family)
MPLHEIVLPETKPETEWVCGRALQKVSPQRTHSLTESGSQKMIYSFTGGNDGAEPVGGLAAVHGVLHGTAECGGADRAGTIFALTTSGQLTLLHTFTDMTDGAYPQGTLKHYGDKLYGTALQGGAGCPGYGCGTVFRISP